MDCIITEAPEYLDELVIYEIATKAFTSPAGPESGSFASTEKMLPYLKDLGINAIWLTGHQLCDPKHFYNIWTEYACIRPDRIDPSLGDEEDFKRLIESSHRCGIRVFLDVITHGVMSDSPLVSEHPDWFVGGSWGMSDFDWYGGHKDLDDWWVETWLRYIRDFGVDGYRLDVAHYRNDLWAKIRKEAAQLGKKILIIAESGPAIAGVTDILQHGEVIGNNYGLNRSFRMLYDVAGYCGDRCLRANEHYEVKIFYKDGTVQDSTECLWFGEDKALELVYEGESTKEIRCPDGNTGYRIQMGKLRVENIHTDKEIENIKITDKNGQMWNSDPNGVYEVDFTVNAARLANGLLLEFPLRIQDGQCLSVQLSCHDNGWTGFPEDKNPYAAAGSRYLAGYASILAPCVPVFMSGEEFNADYRPIPYLTPGLFGEGTPGKGRWLYGAWIDWSRLEIPEKSEMLEDMKRIIGIRRENSALIHPCRMGEKKHNFFPLDYEAEKSLPVPYCYGDENETILIAANPDEKKDVSARFDFSRALGGTDSYRVSVLFGESEKNGAETEGDVNFLSEHIWRIKRDKTSGGGLLVLKIERIPRK